MCFGYLLKNRERFQRILESTPFNVIYVLGANFFCFFSVLLPPDEVFIPKPEIFKDPRVEIWFNITGLVLCVFGAYILIQTVRQRKVIGGQDTSGHLLTTGIYHYFRHPIYTGIILISLAMAVFYVNLDGMLVMPCIFLLNFFTAKAEEKFDMEKRFKAEYSDYGKKIPMFGALWFWSAIILAVASPLILFSLI